jgi:hypothetical protein
LKEIDDAINNDPDFYNTIVNLIAAKAPLASPTFTGTVTLPTGDTAAVPIIFTSGDLKTIPVTGGMEFLTDKAYITITTGAARKEIVLADAALTSGRIPFTTTNGRIKDSANLVWNDSTLVLSSGGVDRVAFAANGTTRIDTSNAVVLAFNGSTKLQVNSATLDFNVFCRGASGAYWTTNSYFGGTSQAPTARVHIAAGTTSAAQMKLEVSAAPTGAALTDGCIWREDNTNTGLKIRINGVTKTITVS